MERRDFLKLVGIIPFAGLLSNGTPAVNREASSTTLEDIPKDGYGWVQVSGTAISGPPYSIEYGYHAGFDLSAERNVKRIANIDTSNLS